MKKYKQYFISDPHFGQESILTFKDKEGNLIRPFKSIEEMDNMIVENWNNIVKPCDRVYILGDITSNKKVLPILDKLIGKKYLIKGNHDTFDLKHYTLYFKDIRAYKMMPEYGIIFSHIPVHPGQLISKFQYNVHGHTHHNNLDDKRYLNVCVEQTNYKPIELQDIIKKCILTNV